MKLKDLKRGMKLTYEKGKTFLITEVYDDLIVLEGLRAIKFHKPTNIDRDTDIGSFGIVEVTDIAVDGYKTIWKRDEKKNYLKLPFQELSSFGYFNYDKRTKKHMFSNTEENDDFKTQFTQEEIDNLPNQDFIKMLIKEEV